MHADDDSKTTLTKWPFILGDVLLVVTALAVALSVDWHLSDWQVAYCVAAVALGALLFVLPYIVEYRVRIIEEQQDRGADLRILNRDLSGALNAVDRLESRLRTLESAAADTFALAPVDDSAVERVRERLEACELRITGVEKVADEVKEALDSQSEAEADVASVSVPTVEDLEEFGSPEPTDSEEDAPIVVEEESASPTLREKPKREKGPQVQRQKRAPRSRHTPVEPRLLQRAIKDKQDGAAEAMTRIIESRARLQLEKEAQIVEPAPEKTVEEDIDSSEAVSAPMIADPEVSREVEGPTDHVVEALAKSDQPPLDESVAKKVEAPEPPPPSADLNTEKEEVDATEAVEMLFEEDPPVVPKKKKRARKKDAVVTASVFIGIGNKPHLRGSGCGLNWEKGVTMDFEEIGKWSWLAPADFDESIEVQVYRNDEDPDTTGKYTLEPGQKLDLWPVFD